MHCCRALSFASARLSCYFRVLTHRHTHIHTYGRWTPYWRRWLGRPEWICCQRTETTLLPFPTGMSPVQFVVRRAANSVCVHNAIYKHSGACVIQTAWRRHRTLLMYGRKYRLPASRSVCFTVTSLFGRWKPLTELLVAQLENSSATSGTLTHARSCYLRLHFCRTSMLTIESNLLIF